MSNTTGKALVCAKAVRDQCLCCSTSKDLCLFFKFFTCALDIIENESLPSVILNDLNKVEWMNEWINEGKMVRAQTKCDLGGIAWEFAKDTSSS